MNYCSSWLWGFCQSCQYCAFQLKEKGYSISIMLPLKRNTTTQQAHLDTGKLSLAFMSSDWEPTSGEKEPAWVQWGETGSLCIWSYMEVHWMSIDFWSDLILMDIVMTSTGGSYLRVTVSWCTINLSDLIWRIIFFTFFCCELQQFDWIGWIKMLRYMLLY